MQWEDNMVFDEKLANEWSRVTQELIKPRKMVRTIRAGIVHNCNLFYWRKENIRKGPWEWPEREGEHND